MHTESFQGVIEAYADTEDRTRELSIGKERKKKKYHKKLTSNAVYLKLYHWRWQFPLQMMMIDQNMEEHWDVNYVTDLMAKVKRTNC